MNKVIEFVSQYWDLVTARKVQEKISNTESKGK